MAVALRAAGLLVDVAADAARAFAKLGTKQFAIVVVNPATPNLSTTDLAIVLRGLTPRPMVLLLTGDTESVRRLGVADVIHGCLRRSGREQVVELVVDAAAAIRESNAIARDPRASGRAAETVH